MNKKKKLKINMLDLELTLSDIVETEVFNIAME